MALKERLIELMDYYKFSNPNEFADKIGIRPDKIYNVLDGKTATSYTLIDEITNCYKEINKEWLKKGTGQMIITNSSETKMPDQGDQAELERLRKEVERLRTLVIDLTEELRHKKK